MFFLKDELNIVTLNLLDHGTRPSQLVTYKNYIDFDFFII